MEQLKAEHYRAEGKGGMIQKNGFLDENRQALGRDLFMLENSSVSFLPNHPPKREKHSQFFPLRFLGACTENEAHPFFQT
jgi:hypothetical protein